MHLNLSPLNCVINHVFNLVGIHIHSNWCWLHMKMTVAYCV